jgi:hypothetical protein
MRGLAGFAGIYGIMASVIDLKRVRGLKSLWSESWSG